MEIRENKREISCSSRFSSILSIFDHQPDERELKWRNVEKRERKSEKKKPKQTPNELRKASVRWKTMQRTLFVFIRFRACFCFRSLAAVVVVVDFFFFLFLKTLHTVRDVVHRVYAPVHARISHVCFYLYLFIVFCLFYLVSFTMFHVGSFSLCCPFTWCGYSFSVCHVCVCECVWSKKKGKETGML